MSLINLIVLWIGLKKVVIFSFLFMWANRIFLDEGCKEVIGLNACDQSFAFIVKVKLNLG